jgi:hypothetical protein
VSEAEILADLRVAVGRIETRQIHILEVLTDHKVKMDRIEAEAQGMKGRVWLISTVVFGILAAAWEVIKSRFVN